MTHNQEEKQLIKTNTEMTQILEQAHTNFKRAIRNLFKGLKKNMVLMSGGEMPAEKQKLQKKSGNSLNEKKIPVIENLLDWFTSKFKIRR